MFIVYEGIDGSVAISTLANHIEDKDIPEIVKKFRECHPGFYKKFSVHETLDVPKSRENRGTWKKGKGNIITEK